MALALAAAAVPALSPLEFVSSAALVLLPKPRVSTTKHALGAEVGTPSRVATRAGDRGRRAKRPRGIIPRGALVHIELLRPPADLPSCARGRPLAQAISTSRPYRRPRRPEPASLPSSPPRRTPS